MPTYSYVCDACEHELEKYQQITAPVTRKCPACGKLKLRRRIGMGAGIIFKGSGFYQTDYRSDGYRKAASAEKTASAGSSESKPAAKTDGPAGKAAAKESGKSADKAAG